MLPELSEIKKFRKRLGLTQAQLAKLANVSQSLVAKIEVGKIAPNYEKVKQIFDAIESLDKAEQKKASDLMSKRVVSVKENDLVVKAAKLMKKYDFSQLPVLKNGKSIGVITERSIIEGMTSGLDVKKTKVSNIMQESLPIVAENTSFGTLACLLENEQALLVASKGEIIGIITKSDLLKALL